MPDIKAPYLPYDDLRPLADQFLRDYNSPRKIPVPIEKIVEFGFRINVVPVEHLMRDHEIDASISNDLSTIYVDHHIFWMVPNRYRFSLAHELAHCVLHKDIFKSLHYSSIAEYKAVIQQIPERERGFIEHQAYSFAGLVLVPSARLADEYRAIVRDFEQAGYLLGSDGVPDRFLVRKQLGPLFEVSKDVIDRRLKYDNHPVA